MNFKIYYNSFPQLGTRITEFHRNRQLYLLYWSWGFYNIMNILLDDNKNVLKWYIKLLWDFHVSYYLSWKLKALYDLCSAHGGHVTQNIFSASISEWEFSFHCSLCLEFIDYTAFLNKQVCSRMRTVSSRVTMALQICVSLQYNSMTFDGVFLKLRWMERSVSDNRQVAKKLQW